MSQAQTMPPADWNRQVIEEFRAGAGKVGGMFEGAPLVLLTTVGVRSGRRHTTPLVYMDDGDRLLVFASNAGGPKDPAWFRNALAEPMVTVEIGAGEGVETFEGTAVALHGAERDRLYALQSELVPAYAEYQRQADRVIPVLALYRGEAPRAVAIGDFLTQVHAELREELAALREETGAYLDGVAAGRPSPDLAGRLRTHCLSVCGALGQHHSSEDGVFPRVEKHAPELAPVLDRLRREHAVVARLKDDLQALLGDLGTGDPGRFRAELDRLTAELEAHFAYEERQLVPVLNAMGPVT